MSALESATPGFLKPLGRTAVGFNLRHCFKSSPAASLSVAVLLLLNLASPISLD